MKKSAVALGVIAVLGGVFTGATWYSGKTAEQQFHAKINQINKKLEHFFNVPNVESTGTVKIDNVKFQRGFFSSDISYELVFSSKESENINTLPFNGKLYHGPLPINQLSQFNFTPVMFSTETEVTKTEKNKDWFGKNGKSPLYFNFSVDYNKQVLGNLNSEVNTHIDGGDIDWKITANYDIDENGFGKVDIASPYVKLVFPNMEQTSQNEEKNDIQSMFFEFTDSQTSLNWNRASAELDKIIVGNYSTKLGNMRFSAKGNDNDILLEMKDSQSDINGKIKDNFVDYDLTYKHGGIRFTSNGQENFFINDSIFNIQFNHLAANPLNIILTETAKAAESGKTQDAPPEEVFQAFIELSKKQPQVKIAPFTLSNKGGKLSADLNVEFAPGDLQAKIRAGKVLEMFKQFALNIDLDNAAILDFLTQIKRLDADAIKEAPEKDAEKTLHEFLSLAENTPLFVVDDKSIKLNAKLENNKINLNGNMLSWEEFVMMLAMVPNSIPDETLEESETLEIPETK